MEIIPWDKISKTPSCWNWVGEQKGNGYGVYRTGGKRYPAHRYIYEVLVAPVKDGLHLDHLCRNRGCVNPTHLEPVTPAVNILRGFGVSGINLRKTHCIAGHELKGVNLYLRLNKKTLVWWRQCKTCRTEAMRRCRARGRITTRR